MYQHGLRNMKHFISRNTEINADKTFCDKQSLGTRRQNCKCDFLLDSQYCCLSTQKQGVYKVFTNIVDENFGIDPNHESSSVHSYFSHPTSHATGTYFFQGKVVLRSMSQV